eukprot:CAMPEP_0201573744 /NCGR_PEP_ID=MMETSP0190_2-20130828/17766_1 /ASSEMBLY_ACC=CAM_ASM_000263 /TAXON_ID=37353 /ORGANISM="Rosalina sp." /LENGTH=116 /DNA_ID=CAMNT_0048001063 /DNA_START=288 /DNA_END=639 /DNA_ORIENTATION=-
MRAYICGMDGLSDVEKEAIATETNDWCPSLSKTALRDLCDIGAKFTEQEAQETIDRVNETYPTEARRALLLNALCGASLDGLDIKEIEGFNKVAKKLKVDAATASQIYDLLFLNVN